MKNFSVLINIEKNDLFISDKDSSDLKRIYLNKGYYIETSYNKDKIIEREKQLRKFIK